MCGIYKIENLINGKIYIGQSVDIQYRFRNHKSESFNPKSNAYDTAIHRAIRKYGVDNFSFEIIEECEQNKLCDREIYWIDYYKSFGNGYNLTIGGEGAPTVNIDQVRKLWDDGLSIDEISTIIPCEKHTAIRILESYNKYNRKESRERGRKVAASGRYKSIVQYDLQGNYIKKYNSVVGASKETNISRSNISAALSGQQLTAGGYQWVYEGNSHPEAYNPQTTCDKKPVLQFDLQGNFIAEHSSLTDAAKSVGSIYPSAISRCCENISHSSYGFIWKWKNVQDINRTST